LANEPKDPRTGLPKNLAAVHAAEEYVRGMMLEFPDDPENEHWAPLEDLRAATQQTDNESRITASDFDGSNPLKSTDKRPTEEVLKLLSFNKDNPYGTYQRDWGAIRVSAAPWIFGWRIVPHYANRISTNKRSIRVLREHQLADRTSPAEFLALLYHWCGDAFEDPTFGGSGTLPPEFQIGQEHWQVLRKKMSTPSR
jgi:hypothetical protein